jgi:hypothetical protein
VRSARSPTSSTSRKARAEGAAVGGYVAALLGVLGALAWLTGAAFLLPSLGPSAYVLATSDQSPRRVAGGQFAGALAAFLAVALLAGDAAPLLGTQAQSPAGGRRIAAALAATVAATAAMYATVLIVALGIADTGPAVVAFAAGVVVLVGTHLAAKRAGVWRPATVSA